MRSRLVTPGLVVLAYAVALIQRPGMAVADTKVDLYTDPARFLSNVLSVWSPTVDLGHLFGAQYSGYVWPMAPWFAAGDALGLPLWLTHRLWLGTILAFAAVGVVAMLRALAPRGGTPLAVGAAVLYVVNPYVTVYLDRTSITLLTYAALPWMLLCVHRGLREPRRWRWPALLALVLTSTGGGVNVAVTAWVVLGPILLVLYERWATEVDWRAVGQWGWRTLVVVVLAQLWWLIPVAVQGMAAPNFLPFTEQPGTIWGTTSLPESLRQMGFWTSYVGVGYGGHLRPFQATATAMLHLLPVVLAGLVLFGGALAAFPLVRRWRYAPFFLLLALTGLLIMTVGWPEGTPLRRAVTGVYYRVETVQFLRTTYKGGALLALSLAVLGGAAFGALWERREGLARRGMLAVASAVLVALAAWPLVSGRAVEPQLRLDVPASWRALARDLDGGGARTRALHLPGALFGYYRWGGTVDPVLPALTRRPVTTRWIVPYSDLRASGLQIAVDALIAQDRARRGQLAPLLDLLSAGTVTLGTDGDRERDGEPPAGQARATLARGAAGDRGMRTAAATYGPTRPAAVSSDSSDAPPRLPELERWERRTAVPLLSLIPRDRPETVVDGGPGGVTALAAFGALDPRSPLVYAPDAGADQIRAAAAGGGRIVVSDTQRRAAFVASRLVGSDGPVLPASRGVSADGAMLDPWLGDPDGQTVQVLTGVRDIDAPSSPQVTQFPERRPFAAVDGDPSTAWLGDRALAPARSRLTVTFARPRDVASIELLPYSDSRAVVRAVAVNGHRFSVRRGWNRLPVALRAVRSLTVALVDVDKPRRASAGRGGIRELRIPGVRVTERLRPPVIAERALAGGAFERAQAHGATLTYLLARITADRPGRPRRYVGERGAGLLRDAQDAERRIARVLAPPLTRPTPVRMTAWAGVDPRTGDDVLDRVAGPDRGGWVVRSSSRYEGLPRYRGSGAFDGTGARGWVGQWIAGRPAWLGWSAPRPVTVAALTLRPLTGLVVRRPTRVALVVDGRRGPELAVGGGGRVTLPAPVRGRDFRLEIVAARFPAGTPGRVRQRRAVAIGELAGAGVPVRAVPTSGRVALGCGTARVRVGAAVGRLHGTLDRARLDAGEGALLQGCGTVALRPGRVTVTGLGGPLRIDALRLSTERRATVAATAGTGGGQHLIGGALDRDGTVTGAAVTGSGRGWLVLGQSFDRHWHARCDGRDLGASRPMQGYANAWRLDGACRELSVVYGPQRVVRAGYLISLLVCLLSLAIAIAGFVGGRGAGIAAAAPAPLPDAAAPSRRSPMGALLVAAAAALPIAFAFGLRAGAVALPVIALLSWRGARDRLLALIAAVGLLVAVPAVYVIVAIADAGEHRGGHDTSFPVDRIAAHWFAVVAVVALTWLALRALRDARVRTTMDPDRDERESMG